MKSWKKIYKHVSTFYSAIFLCILLLFNSTRKYNSIQLKANMTVSIGIYKV